MKYEDYVTPFDSDLEPVIYGKHWDAIFKDKEWQDDEVTRCRIEPWYFLVNYCWSIRRDESGSYVERVPPKEYLRVLTDDWLKHPFLAVSKSRQMMATWLFVILTFWECLYEENIFACCQTKKEDDADTEMIRRAKFVYDKLPSWFRRRFKCQYKYAKLTFPATGSVMKGIPSGGDQIRSHNPNRLLSDEVAFQPDMEESYAAALPCCQRITLVTSANPGWAADFYNDRLKIAS